MVVESLLERKCKSCWPNNEIPYNIDISIRSSEKHRYINETIQRLNYAFLGCLKIRYMYPFFANTVKSLFLLFRPMLMLNEDGLSFKDDPLDAPGCWSLVGYQGSNQPLNLVDYCFPGNIYH